jgi:hypothetical protein
MRPEKPVRGFARRFARGHDPRCLVRCPQRREANGSRSLRLSIPSPCPQPVSPDALIEIKAT